MTDEASGTPSQPLRIPSEVLRECWFLTGPTAVGKTAVSLQLAEAIGAEIVALDSMSLYRGMDIGTAKPDAAARARVPHHLLDILEPTAEFSLAEYLTTAARVCLEILSRGRKPLFVGGTGLYLRAMLRGLFEGPPADWNYRRGLEQFAAEHGQAALHAQLAQIDPVTAARLLPQDQRRVIRALEVFKTTGRPLSAHHQESPLPVEERPRHVLWLSPPRDWLHARINLRVDQMLAEGLVAEVAGLTSAGRVLSRTASQAVGYREVLEHLAGRIGHADMVEQIKTHTRQFAKRQHTWFRHLEEVSPLVMTGNETPSDLVGRIVSGG